MKCHRRSFDFGHFPHGPRHFGRHGCGTGHRRHRHGRHGHRGHHRGIGPKHFGPHHFRGLFSGPQNTFVPPQHGPNGPFPFEFFGPLDVPCGGFTGCHRHHGHHKKWHHDWTKDKSNHQKRHCTIFCDSDVAADDQLEKEELIKIIEALVSRNSTPNPSAAPSTTQTPPQPQPVTEEPSPASTSAAAS